MLASSKVTPRRQLPRQPRLDSLKNPQPHQNAQQTKAQRKPASLRCPNPECVEKNVIEEDGQLVCESCGTVVSDGNIVSEVTFGENSAGAAAVLGSFVAADQSFARAGGGQRLKMSGGMDSREITEANGRRYLNQLGAALTINQSIIDSGMQIFKLAAGYNFVQGRRTKAVAAVCLYIACRIQRDTNRIMLIDFSDVLMLNVFKLGHIYTKLLKALSINGNGATIQPINPEDLILRFAYRLEFGDSTMRVANEAVRIVQRMNRDWMTPGRRPAGICGAALILAARMNNFRRTVREVVYVVKVAEVTILKRLDEFKVTESSGLTVEEFRTIDLERSCDPPAFYEQLDGKKKRGRKRKILEIDDDEPSEIGSQRASSTAPLNTSGQQLTPENTQPQGENDSRSMLPPPIPIDPSLLEVSAQRLSELQSSLDGHSSSPFPQTTPDSTEPPTKRKRGHPPGKAKKSTPPPPVPPPSVQSDDEIAIESDINSIIGDPSNIAHATALHVALEANPASEANSASPSPPPIQQEAPNQDEIPTQQRQIPTRAPIPDSQIISDSEFASDDEVSNCLLTPAEVLTKETIWVHENRDYLRAQQAKLLKQQLAEANGTARKVIPRKRRRGRMGDMNAYVEGEDGDDEGRIAGGSPAEATMKMLMKRAYSKKINYETLKGLYEPSASRSGKSSVRGLGSGRESGAGSPGSGSLRSPALGAVTSPGGTVRSQRAEVVEGGESAEGIEEGEGGKEMESAEGVEGEEGSEQGDYYDEGETLEDIVAEVREEQEEDDEDGGEEYD